MQYKVFVRLERHVDMLNWPPARDVSVSKQNKIKATFNHCGWLGVM